MAISETWKFNENIGKTWRFEGYYYGTDKTHLNKKGVVYVLIKDIQELGTGDVFRDHTHIEVRRSMYERYFKGANENEKVQFTAKTYHYNKGSTYHKHYVRKAVGLTDMNEIKMGMSLKTTTKPVVKRGFPKDMKVKTIGWLVRHIDSGEYSVEKNTYKHLEDKKEVRRLAIDIVDTLITHRGNEKEYNVHEFETEGSSYKAVLTKAYPDYRILKNKDKKYPNYKEVTYKTVDEVYASGHEVRRGKMVLTILRKETGNIFKVYRVKVNNNKEYKKVIEIVMKYFKVDWTEEDLRGIRFDKVNKRK